MTNERGKRTDECHACRDQTSAAADFRRADMRLSDIPGRIHEQGERSARSRSARSGHRMSERLQLDNVEFCRPSGIASLTLVYCTNRVHGRLPGVGVGDGSVSRKSSVKYPALTLSSSFSCHSLKSRTRSNTKDLEHEKKTLFRSPSLSHQIFPPRKIAAKRRDRQADRQV